MPGRWVKTASVRRAISARTKAVVFPHLFGAACDIGDIIALGVPVIEDCAMSLGTERCGVRAGNLGSAAAVFSFYATKVIAGCEGGMVLSCDRALVKRVRDLSDYAEKLDGFLLFNFAMTDMAAALGLSQLERLPSMISRRRELTSRYSAASADTDLELLAEKPGERHIFYRYVVQNDRTEALRMFLRERGSWPNAPLPLFSRGSRDDRGVSRRRAGMDAVALPAALPRAHGHGGGDGCPRGAGNLPILRSLTVRPASGLLNRRIPSCMHPHG